MYLMEALVADDDSVIPLPPFLSSDPHAQIRRLIHIDLYEV